MTEAFLSQEIEVSLKVSELVDLIEAGAVAEVCSGYEPPIVAELRDLFSELAKQLGSTDEV